MSTTSTPAGRRAAAQQALDHLDAEAVVAEEDVADAGDQDPAGCAHRSPGLELVGPEVAEAAVRELHARRPGRRRRDTATCTRAVDVVHARPARWRASREERVLGVAAAARAQHDLAALGHRHAADQHGVGLRVDGRVLAGSHQGSCSGRSARARRRRRPCRPWRSSGCRAPAPRPHRADRAVQPLQHLRRHGVDRVDDRRRRAGRWRGPRAFSSSVRTSVRSVEDLVVLGAVEEVGRALGGELRVVVEDDRRGQQQVAAVGRSGQHRPGVLVDALRDGGLGPLAAGRCSDRNDPGSRPRAACVPRSATCAAPPRAGRRRRTAAVVDDVEPQPEHAVGPGESEARDDQPGGHRPAVAPDAGPRRAPVAVADLLGLLRAGSRTGRWSPRAARRRRSSTASTWRRHALLEPAGGAARRRRVGAPACRPGSSGVRRLQLQEPQPDVQRVPRRGRVRAGTPCGCAVGLAAVGTPAA